MNGPKPKVMWIVCTVHSAVTVQVGGPFGSYESTMPFEPMFDGYIGACYAFKTKRQARAFSGKRAVLMKVNAISRDSQTAEAL
jgi:hypothetical protein